MDASKTKNLSVLLQRLGALDKVAFQPPMVPPAGDPSADPSQGMPPTGAPQGAPMPPPGMDPNAAAGMPPAGTATPTGMDPNAGMPPAGDPMPPPGMDPNAGAPPVDPNAPPPQPGADPNAPQQPVPTLGDLPADQALAIIQDMIEQAVAGAGKGAGKEGKPDKASADDRISQLEQQVTQIGQAVGVVPPTTTAGPPPAAQGPTLPPGGDKQASAEALQVVKGRNKAHAAALMADLRQLGRKS